MDTRTQKFAKPGVASLNMALHRLRVGTKYPGQTQAPILQNLTPLALAVGLPRLQEMAKEQNRDETRILEWFLLQNMGLTA